MKNILKLIVLTLVSILPIKVAANSANLDLEREVYEHSLNIEHNISKIGICTEDVHPDDTLCLNVSGKIDNNNINNERLITFLELKYILMDDTLLYYSENERTHYSSNSELQDKYNSIGDYLQIMEKMADFDRISDDELNKVEETIDGKTITKYYKDDILLGEGVDNEYEVMYYESGNKMVEMHFSDPDNENMITVHYYDEQGNEIIYEKFNTTDYIMSGYFILGELNVGENNITINPYGNRDNVVEIPTLINIKVNRAEAPIIIDNDEKEENTSIKEDDNIKESPNTGSIINIIISTVLVLSLSILLYFNRKYKVIKE